MIRSAAAVAALVIGVGAASASQATVTVVGGTRAKQCMDSAFAGARSREAVNQCNVALSEEALSPRNRAGTYVNRGVVLMNRGQLEAAIADFQAAHAIQPSLGDALFNRGSARIALGQYAEGAADIERGMQLGLSQPEKGYYNRAIAREELDDARGAYLDYRAAARLKPDWDLPRKELTRFTVSRR